MRRLCTMLLLVLGLCVSGSAQSTGTISGRVTDPTGAVVSGANIVATNTGTGTARNTVTSSEGEFNLPALTPGVYNVSVNATGFAKSEMANQTLVTGSTLTLNFTLNIGSSTQEVEVTSAAPLVELTESSVSDTLQTSEVQNLPILNRNFSGLVALVPSARPTPPSSVAKTSLGGGLGFGGGNGRNGVAEVDGVTLRDDANGGVLYNLTLEGVQEFNVIGHDYPAQYGQISGGIVLITTKSGTNQLHGSAFGFGRNQAMTGIDYFSEPANGGSGKPPYSREEFGGSLGGKIITDKLFAFGAIEDIRLNQSIVWPGSEFSQATILKNALLSYTSCAICQTVGNALTPATYVPETIRDLQTSFRGDYQITPHHSLFIRWLGEHDNAYDDILTAHPDNDPNGSNNVDNLRGDDLVLSETWVIGDKSVNTFAVAGTQFSDYQYCNCSLTGAAQIYRNITFPDFSVGSQVGNANTKEIDDNVQIKDTFSHQAGNHALKFGGDITFFPRLGFERSNSGSVAFFADPSAILADTKDYPQGLLTPGAMKTVTVSTVNFGGPAANGRVWGGKEYSAFIQDDWKVSPKLTVNMGLRYSVDVNFFNEGLEHSNRALQLLQAIGSPYGGTVGTPLDNFSPRGGLVWNPDGKGKNVLRVSFGIYFDESLAVNVIATDPEEQPTLQNISATFTNTSVGAGQMPSSVYGGALPTTLAPGLTTFLPGGNSTLTWLNPKMGNPYNEQSHIGYTRQLTPTTVVSVDYTHILGLHEIHSEPVNPTESTAWDPNATSYNTCGLTGTYRRLQCAFNSVTSPGTIGAVNIVGSTNRSQYNETIFHFEKRTRPVTLQANYVLSYAYAFGGAIGATGSQGGALASEIPFQWFAPSEWGPSSTDERHRVVLSGVINFPWRIQASPVFQFGTARPYNCLSATDWTKSSNGDTRCVMSSSGQLVAPPASAPLPSGETTVSVDSLRGTATWDLDSRFTKSFSFREHVKLDAFVELYNITDKANFGNNYGGTYGSAIFRQPLGYLNNGLSLPTSRQLQLGARLTF